jgi:hypothetical protein
MTARCPPLPGLTLFTFLSLACGSGNPIGAGPDDGTPPAPGVAALREVATGLDFPVFLTAPTGDQNRLFVVEKGGRIRIIRNGALLPTPFLDVSAKVSTGSEQGLLGLAFHPDYANNGVFVVNYTNTSGDTRVASYRVSANADVASAASEQILLAVAQPFANHNGGMVVFGPDGKLYLGPRATARTGTPSSGRSSGSRSAPREQGASLGTILSSG